MDINPKQLVDKLWARFHNLSAQDLPLTTPEGVAAAQEMRELFDAIRLMPKVTEVSLVQH